MKMSEIPNRRHYALIEFDQHSVYHEGDDRSRTNPGHGYPAYTETFDTSRYYVFFTKEELEKELTKRQTLPIHSSKKNFRVLDVNPLEFNTSVTVRLSGSTEYGL